ncbi:hypothetical protein HGM15179_020453, partial [Zosterops borbonicus]
MLNIDQRENMWPTWANRAGQDSFCLSLATPFSPFHTCLIRVPLLSMTEFKNWTQAKIYPNLTEAWNAWCHQPIGSTHIQFETWCENRKIPRNDLGSQAVAIADLKLISTEPQEFGLLGSVPDNGLPSGVFSSPGSPFILDEQVQLTVGLQTQERHLILFSDVLVIAKSKTSSCLKLKKQMHLSEVWTGTCLSKVTEKKMSPENSFVIGWPITNYVVTFRHINEVKQNDYLKNVTLQIIVLDDDNCSSTTAINVSNVETAESVMKKTVLQLGLPGRTSEHHLWVVSGKDEPAYPLIGHEYLFSITLSCLQDSADQQQRISLLGDGTEASFLAQLLKEKQCQFVLKPRLQAPLHLRR